MRGPIHAAVCAVLLVAYPGAVGVATAETSASAHCATTPKPSPFVRTEVEYEVPPVVLLDQAGRPFPMDRLAGEDRLVALNFIFATCTTICPVMTSTFAQVRRTLGAAGGQVHFVSVTIDPEYDTPAVLARYAEKFGASADWDLLTGSAQDVKRVSRAFGIGSGSKFSHRPITFLRQPGQAKWVRLEGLGGGSALADELRPLLK